MVPVLLSAVATVTFAVLYQIPRRAIAPVGLLGAVAFACYAALMALNTGDVFASFVASLAVSSCSELFARGLRMPVTVFAMPGIIVLVPGMTAYQAMKALVDGHVLIGLSMGINTALVAGALASGLAVAGVVARLVWRGDAGGRKRTAAQSPPESEG
jgi:uncharacterized membrane protein YjjB (DUF3815 family)